MDHFTVHKERCQKKYLDLSSFSDAIQIFSEQLSKRDQEGPMSYLLPMFFDHREENQNLIKGRVNKAGALLEHKREVRGERKS